MSRLAERLQKRKKKKKKKIKKKKPPRTVGWGRQKSLPRVKNKKQTNPKKKKNEN